MAVVEQDRSVNCQVRSHGAGVCIVRELALGTRRRIERRDELVVGFRIDREKGRRVKGARRPARRAASRTKSVRVLPVSSAARSISPRSSGLMRQVQGVALLGARARRGWRENSSPTNMTECSNNVITSSRLEKHLRLSAAGQKASKGNARPPLGGSALLASRLIRVALTKKELVAHLENGQATQITFSHPDVLIAASAAHHGLTVVTRNVREFVEAGVAVINPWADPGTNP